jgi:hypothetical protein
VICLELDETARAFRALRGEKKIRGWEGGDPICIGRSLTRAHR